MVSAPNRALFGQARSRGPLPLILLAALFPLCLRAGRLRALLVTASAAVVTWLPLVVLGRPPLRAYLLWQAAEVAYIFVIWSYLITAAHGRSGGIGSGLYFAALAGRFLTVALLAALIVRDILRPDKDLVRRDGDDDPAGGVLDGAPDAVILRLRSRPALTS
jgi:hypothetical protein